MAKNIKVVLTRIRLPAKVPCHIIFFFTWEIKYLCVIITKSVFITKSKQTLEINSNRFSHSKRTFMIVSGSIENKNPKLSEDEGFFSHSKTDRRMQLPWSKCHRRLVNQECTFFINLQGYYKSKLPWNAVKTTSVFSTSLLSKS